MKKLILLFTVVIFLSGCKCVLSQIQPQYIYAGQNCQAPLPDYLTAVHATDNCSLASLSQIPLPGFILDPDNMFVNVIIRATDNSGNQSQINFSVTLIDTIAPVITVDNLSLTTDNDKIRILKLQMDKLFGAWLKKDSI